MNRRAFLVTTGVAATAGCLGFGSSTQTDESGAKTATTDATATAAETATATATPDATSTDGSAATTDTEPLVNTLFGSENPKDAFETVVPFGNGEFICGGAVDGPQARSGWAASITGDGEKTGERVYEGGRGSEVEHGIQLADGYLFVGNISPNNRKNVVGWAVRTDPSGNPQWTWRHDPSGPSVAKGAARLSDGFLVAGTTIGDGQTAWLATLTTDGSLRSTRTFTEGSTVANGLLETDDGPVLLGARGADRLKPWLVGIGGASGNRWSKQYDVAGGYFDSGTVTADGYVLAGETDVSENTGNTLTVGTDPTGAVRWRDTFGEDGTESLLFGAETLADGDVAVVGGTLDNDAGTAVAEVLRYGPTGDRRFERTYENGRLSFLSDVIQRPDGALFCAGLGNYGGGNGDAWVLIVPSN